MKKEQINKVDNGTTITKALATNISALSREQTSQTETISGLGGQAMTSGNCYCPDMSAFYYYRGVPGYCYNIGILTDEQNMKDVEKLPKSLRIRGISYCDRPGKEKVILVFEDGSKIIKEMCKGDTFDLKIGVALAYMEHLYGTKSQYHKMIQKKLPKNK